MQSISVGILFFGIIRFYFLSEIDMNFTFYNFNLELRPSNIRVARPDNSKNLITLKDHKPFFDSHSSICLFQCFGKNHCSGLQGFGAPIFLHRWRR